MRDGDIIKIDVPSLTLDVLVDEAEMAKRREGWQPNPPRYTTGVLGKYARLAQGAEKARSRTRCEARSARATLASLGVNESILRRSLFEWGHVERGQLGVDAREDHPTRGFVAIWVELFTDQPSTSSCHVRWQVRGEVPPIRAAAL